MTESLFANRTRLFVEDGIGTGIATGEVIEPPLVAAAAARRILAWDQRINAFRVPEPRTPLHQSYELALSFEVNPWLAGWILNRHMTSSGGNWILDREAPEPTFSLQVETEGGDRIGFAGMAMIELLITFSSRSLVTIDTRWHAMSRDGTLGALEAVTNTYETTLTEPNDIAVAVALGSLAADSRDDIISSYGGTVVISRQDLQLAQFDAGGQPAGYTRAPWRVIGDVDLPDGALPETGRDGIQGAWAMLLGPDGQDIDLRASEASIWVEGETIKADDFRDAKALWEAHPEQNRGSILEMRDNT